MKKGTDWNWNWNDIKYFVNYKNLKVCTIFICINLCSNNSLVSFELAKYSKDITVSWLFKRKCLEFELFIFVNSSCRTFYRFNHYIDYCSFLIPYRHTTYIMIYITLRRACIWNVIVYIFACLKVIGF